MWGSFRVAGTVAKKDKILIPEGFDSGVGFLDLRKVRSFFSGSTINFDALKAIRLRNSVIGEPMREPDIEEVFDAYCNQLHAKRVVYHYNAQQSPFDADYTGNSNCQGRAKGFLQLMAMLGVPKEHLAYCIIGGAAGEEEMKVCQKAAAEIIASNVRWVPGGPNAPVWAPNAVRIDVVRGALRVDRTTREPFANHYATHIGVSGLGKPYWDPLERYSSKNGFADVFTSYQPSPQLLAEYSELERRGGRCLVNPDNQQERLYLLPARAERRLPATQGMYYTQQAFLEVEYALAEMSAKSPQVLMIVDKTDYDHGSAQPPALQKMFAG